MSLHKLRLKPGHQKDENEPLQRMANKFRICSKENVAKDSTFGNHMEIAEKACRYWMTCTFKVYFDVFTVGTFLFLIHEQRFVAATAMIHYCLLLV